MAITFGYSSFSSFPPSYTEIASPSSCVYCQKPYSDDFILPNLCKQCQMELVLGIKSKKIPG